MKLSFLLPLLLCYFSVFAQYPGGFGGGKVTITGSLVDEQSQAPLEYASVSFHRVSDSSLISGTVTNTKGQFEVELAERDFFLKAYFLGYNELTAGPFNVAKDKVALALGKIQMSQGSTAIKEVEVTARKSTMELQLDKRVFNVGSDLSNTGNNALEVLENVPSVEVDVEGNVNLRGSGNVRILIDGKPSGLLGVNPADALRFLQGDQIEKIEVVTNPSAKYDAEGDAGILNIILKKDKKKGLNGSVSVNTGYPHNHGITGTINYRSKKVTFNTSYGFNYRKRPGSGYYYQESFSEDTTIIFERDREHERGGYSNTFRAGVDFQINSFNSISFSGSFQDGLGDNFSSNRYTDYNVQGDVLSQSLRLDPETEDERSYDVDISYQKTFEEKGRKWTASAKFISSRDGERSDISQFNTIDVADTIFQRVYNDENQTRWLFETDYVHPFEKGVKIETGFRTNLRDITNNYLVEQKEVDKWEVFRGIQDSLSYKENVIAGYFQLGHKIGKFSWQAGLRSEYTIIDAVSALEGATASRNYIDFFPSVFLSYDLGKDYSVQVSYSRRLSRPWFRQLLPFSNFSDARSIWVGNPNLNPEYTHSMEISFLKDFEKGSFLVSPYYRYTTGPMERILVVDSLGNSFSQSQNLDHRHALGLEVSYQQTITEWWDLNMNMNLFYNELEAGPGLDYLDASAFSGGGRIMSKWHLPWKMDMQASVGIQAPRNTSQGFRKGIYTLDLSLSQKLFDGQGILSASVRDVFNSRVWRSNLNQPDFTRISEFQWAQRQFTVSFSYYFNQQPRMQRGMGTGGGGGGEF